MSDRPPLLPFPYETFELDEITDSEETFYPTQETPVVPNRRLPDGLDDDEGEQEVLPSEEEQQGDEARRNVPLHQDRREQDGDQRPNKREGEDGGTPLAKAKVDKQEETPQKVDTKSEMTGLKRTASIVNGPKDEKRSVPPAAPNEALPHGDPEGSSTREGEQGK